MLVFCCIFGRVCPLSCRGSGDPSGRGHAAVPRGRRRSVLPARASLAHSDPLVSSSIAFCWALRRVRRSWGRYIRPQEWTLGSNSRAVAVNSRATLLLSDGASCLTAASYVRLTPSCVVTLCDLSKICTIAVPVGSGLITVKTSNFVFRQSTSQLHLGTIVLASAVVPLLSSHFRWELKSAPLPFLLALVSSQ